MTRTGGQVHLDRDMDLDPPSAGPRANVRGTRGPGPGASGRRPTEQCWVVAPHGLLSCCPPLVTAFDRSTLFGIQPREVTD